MDTKKRLKELIRSDVYRHYGGGKKQFLWRIRDVSLLYMMIYRKAHYYSKMPRSRFIFGLYYRYRLNRLMRKYLIQIPYTVEIDFGCNIVHFGRVIVAPYTKIGSNCNIFTGVTIGSTARGDKKGVPTIGNDVWIGPNAVIVGKINIGNNVLIAANSYVNFDVPDNSIVLGNPARIIPKPNATQDYICQRYEQE